MNGVQPGKHENGFSGTGGPPELLELSHHGTSPGSIIPFGDKEPFLKQAVVKPPQVTGERWGVCRGEQGCCAAVVSLLPPPPLQRCCEGQAPADVPAVPPHTSRLRTPAQNRSFVTRRTSLLPPARPCHGGPGGVWDPGEGETWFLSSFLFLFCFFKYAPYQTDTPTLAARQSRPRCVV